MTRILAAVDNSAACCPVLGVAAALAVPLGGTVEALQVADRAGQTVEAAVAQLGVPLTVVAGDPLERIVEQAAADDVAAVVVGMRARPGGRRPAGHLALGLADRMDKPVVLVPPDVHVPEAVTLVLVAMEGTRSRERRLRRAISVAVGAGLELVVVHVDDESSIPAFSDQVQYETAAYAREFLARYLPGAPAARLESRVGVPAEQILAAAADLHPTLLAMGWPHGGPERGSVVREVLDRTPVPVLLVGLAEAPVAAGAAPAGWPSAQP